MSLIALAIFVAPTVMMGGLVTVDAIESYTR